MTYSILYELYGDCNLKVENEFGLNLIYSIHSNNVSVYKGYNENDEEITEDITNKEINKSEVFNIIFNSDYLE